jgi:hypothetical protein
VALALNAVGASLAGWLIARCCWGAPQRPYWVRGLLCLVLPSTFLAGGALAGYWGFSSMLYSALILLLFSLAVEARGRTVLAIPVLCLFVSLFRPDGAFIGVTFALLALWTAWSERQFRNYLVISAACAIGGLGYFVWRWSYFGLLLPLPLYVKQNAALSEARGLLGVLPGLESHWRWLADPTGPLPIVLGLLVALYSARFWRNQRILRLLLFMLPLAVLLAILSFAVQSQNVASRFQAPVYLVLLYALLDVAGRLIDAPETRLSRLLMIGLVSVTVMPANWAGYTKILRHRFGAWSTYLEAFAPRFGPSMGPDTVVALTEAGAVPYWTKAQIADIVGLNYPDVAIRPPTVETLRRLEPDMVFLHQAMSLANDVLIDTDAQDVKIHQISPQRLGKALRPARREIVERGPISYDQIGLLNTQYAPSVMIKFLSDSRDYDIFVVDPKGEHSYIHIYGLSKNWSLRDEALQALRWSLQPENYRSYLEVRKLNEGRTLQ